MSTAGAKHATGLEHRLYDSMGELLRFVEELPGTPSTSELSWRGGVTFADCVNLARSGWPEGVAKARTVAQKIAARIVEATGAVEQDALEYDNWGAGFDVGAVISGVPECWIRLEPQKQKRAVVIVTNVCASGGVPAKALMTRGIAVSALVMALQAQGHPVTVWCGAELGNNGYPEALESAYVKILDANYPTFDLDRAVFALAHPGFFRWLLFAESECEKTGRLDRMRSGHVIEHHRPPELQNSSLYLGSAHLFQATRWTDGGEAWILEEYNCQTKEL